MIECVLSRPVTVEVQPLPVLFEKLRMFCDADSYPRLHAFEQSLTDNPYLGKRPMVCLHSHERVEYRDHLADIMKEAGRIPADPVVALSTLLALSGEEAEVTRRRRHFMKQGKTILCLPLIYAHAFGGHVHLVIDQNQCEHKRGQRPWAIRHIAAETRIQPLYDTIAILNE